MSHWASLALVAALALGASACGDDDPVADPPVATSPAADAHPTPTHRGPVEPTLPAAAKKPGKNGAEAFVRYYWSVVNYAMHTGDTGRLGMLQTDGCQRCSGGVDWIGNVYAAGGRIRGGTYRVVTTHSVRAPDGSAHWIVAADVRSKRSVVAHAGKLNARYKPARETVTFTLHKSRTNGWLVDSWNE